MNDVDDSDHELTDEQRDKLRKAIGEIIGDFTPWILCVDTTPISGIHECLIPRTFQASTRVSTSLSD